MSIVSQKKLESSLALLGVSADQSWQEVQAQYRQLVQQWHPDRHTGEDGDIAQTKFIELNTAFKALRDHYRKTGALPMQTSVELDGPLLGTKLDTATRVHFWRKRWFVVSLACFGLLFIVTFMMMSLDAREAESNRDRAHVEKLSLVDNNEKEQAEMIKPVTQATLQVP